MVAAARSDPAPMKEKDQIVREQDPIESSAGVVPTVSITACPTVHLPECIHHRMPRCLEIREDLCGSCLPCPRSGLLAAPDGNVERSRAASATKLKSPMMTQPCLVVPQAGAARRNNGTGKHGGKQKAAAEGLELQSASK
jgi:hypothetical protein